MRSFGNRDDTVVVDEPLYAHYLLAAGKPHPGANDVIAAGETDWRKVVAQLTGPVPSGEGVYYQKHMTHHLLPGMDRQWLAQLTNCFLIRHPREVLASYTKVVETPELHDLGFVQQTEIFEWVRDQSGRLPPIIDAADVLRDPRRTLGVLCDAVGIKFQDSMLSWSPGSRPTDGVWAKYWYSEVEKSTGFRPYQPKQVDLSPRFDSLYAECLRHYEMLYEHRLT
jgi:hypothetical protein